MAMKITPEVTPLQTEMSALDIVTVSLFAAVNRLIWFPINFIRFLAPFDLLISMPMSGIPNGILAAIVRKPGTMTLQAAVNSLLGAVIFGTSFWIWPVNIGRGIIEDFIYSRTIYRWGPSRKTNLWCGIGGAVAIIYDLTVWMGLIQRFAFGIVWPLWMYPAVIIGTAIGVFVTYYIGMGLGEKIRALTI